MIVSPPTVSVWIVRGRIQKPLHGGGNPDLIDALREVLP